MKIYKVSIQRLKQIIDAYEDLKTFPQPYRIFKIGEKDIFIEIGDKK